MNDDPPSDPFDAYFENAARDPVLQRRQRQIASVSGEGADGRVWVRAYALVVAVAFVFVFAAWVVLG